jgi:hypothetical protein
MCLLKGHIFPKKQVVPAPLKKSSIGSTTFLNTIALCRFQLFERACYWLMWEQTVLVRGE